MNSHDVDMLNYVDRVRQRRGAEQLTVVAAPSVPAAQGGKDTIPTRVQSSVAEVLAITRQHLSPAQLALLEELVQGQREFVTRFGSLGDLALLVIYTERVEALEKEAGLTELPKASACDSTTSGT